MKWPKWLTSYYWSGGVNDWRAALAIPLALALFLGFVLGFVFCLL